MLFKHLSIAHSEAQDNQERRWKSRFPMQRELRYKLLKDGATVETGTGQTVDIGSGGVAFSTGSTLPAGNFIELSISWPVLLQDTCAMRLIVFGRVVRNADGMTACTVDKYEFRTQSRVIHAVPRTDSALQKWADTVRRESAQTMKTRMMTA